MHRTRRRLRRDLLDVVNVVPGWVATAWCRSADRRSLRCRLHVETHPRHRDWLPTGRAAHLQPPRSRLIELHRRDVQPLGLVADVPERRRRVPFGHRLRLDWVVEAELDVCADKRLRELPVLPYL